MDILYHSKQLEKLCNEGNAAIRKLGPDSARKLRARLSELDAAANVMELQIGKPHPLQGDRLGQFSLALAGGARLVFEPADEPVPCKADSGADSGVDWSAVTRVRIVYIGDYHD